MDFKEILELIDKIDKSSLSKFSYKDGNQEIKIKKKENVLKEQELSGCKDNQENVLDKSLDKKEEEEFEYIKSCLIGTFYSSPSPDEKAYISVGDKISKDQIIGIVEVMKVMNEVKSSCDGIVEEILINNNETVEYGQNLVKIKKV